MARHRRSNGEGSITRRRDGRWMGQIRLGHDPATGRPVRQTVYGRTRADVAAQLARIRADVSRGVHIPPHRITVADWLQTWLTTYQRPRLRPMTYQTYEAIIRVHLIPGLGALALADLRPEHVQRLHNAKRDAGLSAATLRYLHTVLHGACAQAVRSGLLARDPSEAVNVPAAASREVTPWSLREARQFLAATQGDRLGIAWLLALGTGMRRGEILALRWQDVDLDAGIMHIRQSLVRVRRGGEPAGHPKTQLLFQPPKTERSQRLIPLPPIVLDALRRHRASQAAERLRLGEAYDEHDLVICQANGRPLDPRNFVRAFGRRVAKADVPRIRVHDLRHTYATALLAIGEPAKIVQTLLGHSKIATTLDIYSHVDVALVTSAAAKLDAALRA